MRGYPKTSDKVNYNLQECFLYVLSQHDIIKEGDFIRELYETGDEGGFNTTYKSDEWSPLEWHLVDNEIPGWIGKSIVDYLEFDGLSTKEELEHRPFEIVRVIYPKGD